MKIKYIKFKEIFFKDIETNEDTIIVFSDYFLKNTYMKSREKNILKPDGELYTIEEFQRKIFRTHKILLTDSKRPISFYASLSSKIKTELNIKSYYDIIDIADLFFKYYKEINLNLITNFSKLEKWQIEYLDRFSEIRKDYDKFLSSHNYLPIDWLECEDNFDENSIKNIKKIIFIDIPNFSPLLKKIIKKLDTKLNIEFLIQIDKNFFDEENLKIKKIVLDKIPKEKIKIYETKDSLEEMLNLIYILEERKTMSSTINNNIYSPCMEKNIFSKILPKYFKTQKMDVLENSFVYKFMLDQSELLNSIEYRKKDGVETKKLKLCLENEIFIKIYNIDDDLLKIFKNIFNEGYEYLNKSILLDKEFDFFFNRYSYSSDLKLNFISTFNKIYDDLIILSKFSTTDEFYEYFKTIKLLDYVEINYTNFIEKFNEVFENIKSSENICGISGFKELFKEKTGKSLYTLLIKSLEGIEVKEVEREESNLTIGKIKNIAESRISTSDVYFVDFSNETIPGSIKDSLIFTEKQKEINGFMTVDERVNILKYRFMQSIKNAREVTIFTKKIEEKEIDKSIFLEELIMENDICIEKNNISPENILKLLEKSFYKKPDFLIKQKYMDIDKVYNEKMSFGAYDIISLSNCEYQFFLSNIMKIAPENQENYGLSLRLIGISVHEIFEKVSKLMSKKIIENKDFSLDEEFIDKELIFAKIKNNMKVPVFIDIYLDKIIYPTIKKSIYDFLKVLEKEFNFQTIQNFYSEKEKVYRVEYDYEKPEITIVGRVDLAVENNLDKNLLIDFKTGSKKDGQLDIYSLIMYGDTEKAEKAIYNVFTSEFSKYEKTTFSKEKIVELFNNFAKNKIYTRTDKKSICNNCKYINICRRGDNNE